MKHTGILALSLLMLAPFAGAQRGSDQPTAIADLGEVPVTVDNFVRAASDIEFAKYLSLAGGVNRFTHFRAPTTVERQPTIRMNRDTLYSIAVIDVSDDAALVLPDVDERYLSSMIVNQDHFIPAVFHGGGRHRLKRNDMETDYVLVIIRTLVDAGDPDDVAAVNALQDAMTIEAGSAAPFIPPPYDEESYEGLVAAILGLSPFVPDSTGMFGSREDIAPVKHFVGTASGWGGLPETEAIYVNVDPQLPPGRYRIDVPADVPVDAFWSISLYNAAGFFEPNDLGAYSLNSVTGERDGDGSMTVHLGGCDDGRVNCLPIMEGWNYTVRLYLPAQEVLDGSWEFPAAQRID
jgi:hypothetical protein